MSTAMTCNLGVRVTVAQLEQLRAEAERLTRQLGIKVTVSAVARKLLSEALRAQK